MLIVDTSKKMDLTLAPETEEEARMQELYILVCSIKGECPLYRDFGISNDFRHLPINAAETAMTMAITEALRRYMPGITLENIRFTQSDQDVSDGILKPILEVSDT